MEKSFRVIGILNEMDCSDDLITLVNTIFVTRNVECASYVTFYAEFKNVIRIFLSPIGFV
jgi:hypothetical protein